MAHCTTAFDAMPGIDCLRATQPCLVGARLSLVRRAARCAALGQQHVDAVLHNCNSPAGVLASYAMQFVIGTSCVGMRQRILCHMPWPAAAHNMGALYTPPVSGVCTQAQGLLPCYDMALHGISCVLGYAQAVAVENDMEHGARSMGLHATWCPTWHGRAWCGPVVAA